MDFARDTLRRVKFASTAVGALMLAWPALESAQAQNLSIPGLESFTNSVGGAITGLWGKKDGDTGPIDYRPRPALVVPPNYNLPPPQAHVARGANWPKDPDAAALRQAREDSRRPAPSSDPGGGDGAPSQDTAAITTNQSGRTVSCSNVAGTPVCISTPFANIDLPSIPGLDMIPGLGKKDKDQGEAIRLNPNPTRKFLTDPPVSYLEAVEVPQNAEAKTDQAKKQVIERAPPAVDRTPPGK